MQTAAGHLSLWIANTTMMKFQISKLTTFHWCTDCGKILLSNISSLETF